ncbi:MAG: hypothetical protein ACT4NU_10465 [Chromatiales bacterium]
MQRLHHVIRYSETAELYYSLFLCVYLMSIWRRIRQPRGAW